MNVGRSTRVTVLTPPGRAALTTVAVEGPDAITILSRYFVPVSGSRWPEQALDQIRFGHWAQSDGEEVIVALRGAESVEIHGHGGSEAVRAMIEDLIAAGCKRRSWQASISDHATDAIARDARVALADARTERTAGILLDQLQGALRHAIDQIVATVRQGEIEQAGRGIRDLLDRAKWGRHLTRPWKVVLSGRPNVGKSSLMNRIAGYERAIVFDQPGTTRDVVTTSVALDGWPIELADTAGLRTADELIEQAGVLRAKDRLAEADLRVLVFDASVAWSTSDQALVETWPDAMRVYNKRDLGCVIGSRPDGIATSALEGTGVDALIGAIVQRLVPEPPIDGDPVPFTDEQIDRLGEALQALHEKNPDDAIVRLQSDPFR